MIRGHIMISKWSFLMLAAIISLASSVEKFAEEKENEDQLKDSNSEDEGSGDGCPECQTKSENKEERVTEAFVLKILEQNRLKKFHNQHNIFDKLRQISLVLNTNKNRVKELIVEIKDGQNDLDTKHSYVFDNDRKRIVKRQVNDQETQNEENNVNKLANPDPNTGKKDETQNNENTDATNSAQSASNSQNSEQATNSFTVSTDSENTKNYNEKGSDESNLRNAEVNNFQDSNVTNTNDSSTNDTAAATLNVDKQTDQNSTQNSSSVSFDDSNNINASDFAQNNTNNNSSSNADNGKQVPPSSEQSVNENVNNTHNDSNGVAANNIIGDFNFKESTNLEGEPIERFENASNLNETVQFTLGAQNDTFDNSSNSGNYLNSNPDIAFRKSNGDRHKIGKANSNKVDNNSFDNTESHNVNVKVPLSSNQLSNLQNVLNKNYGVNSHNSQPVANFQLDKSKSDEKPVIVIVYNCSCNKGSDHVHNESKNVEDEDVNSFLGSAGEFPNTRRMMHDNPITDNFTFPQNDDSGLTNDTKEIQSYSQNNESKSRSDVANLKSEDMTSVGNKRSAASIENDLLIKCKSLLAIEAENAENFAKNRRYDGSANNSEVTNNESQVRSTSDQSNELNRINENNPVNGASNDVNYSEGTNFLNNFNASKADVTSDNVTSDQDTSHNAINNSPSQNQESVNVSHADTDNEALNPVNTTNQTGEHGDDYKKTTGDSSSTNNSTILDNQGSDNSNQQNNTQFNSTAVNRNENNTLDNDNGGNNSFALENGNQTQNDVNNTKSETDNTSHNEESSVTTGNIISNLQSTTLNVDTTLNSKIDSQDLNPIQKLAETILRKRRNVDKDKEIIELPRKKRDVLSNINEAVKNIFQLPSQGFNLLTSVLDSDADIDNRTKRELDLDKHQSDEDTINDDPLQYYLNYNKYSESKDFEENSSIESEKYGLQNSNLNDDDALKVNNVTDDTLMKLINLLRPIEINVFLTVDTISSKKQDESY